MHRTSLAAALAITAAPISLAGYNAGDIVFVDGANDAVRIHSGGALHDLYTFDDPTGDQVRLGGIQRVQGRFYVSSGFAFPMVPSQGRVHEIKRLFASPESSVIAQSNPLENIGSMAHHRPSGRLLIINNTAQSQMQPIENDGVLGVRTTDGDVMISFDEDIGSTESPRYQAGADIVADPFNKNRFYVTCVNGGALQGAGDDNKGSAIYQLDVDPTGAATATLFHDFSFGSPFGPLNFVRGIDIVIGDDGLMDFYFTDRPTNAIYKADLDDTGDVVSISMVMNQLANPGSLDYNPYTNKLVFSTIDDQSLNQINLDGTGFEVLATGVNPRGYYFVPAPAASTLLALSSLAAMRRRR